MRYFSEVIFFGAGDHTTKMIYLLKKRLDNAFSFLSGSQQPPHWEGKPSKEYLEREELYHKTTYNECRDVIEDIATALGYNVKVTKKSMCMTITQ
jgi:hypothetical protein